MVRIHPDPPTPDASAFLSAVGCVGVGGYGGVAQLGEHLLCKQGVIGSIPFTSTSFSFGSVCEP